MAQGYGRHGVAARSTGNQGTASAECQCDRGALSAGNDEQSYGGIYPILVEHRERSVGVLATGDVGLR